MLRQNGSKKKAVDHLVDATNKFPEQQHSKLSWATSISVSRITNSPAAYQAALKVDPIYDRAHLKLGELLVKEAKVDDALKYFEASLKKNPKGALMDYGLANLKKQIASTSGELWGSRDGVPGSP